jgi:hypothetical protein
MNPEEQQPAITPPASGDSVSKGVLRAILWQVGIIIGTIPILMFAIWGLTQWAALVPQYLRFKKDGYPLAAMGVLIMDFLGVLLNAGCFALLLTLSNRGNMR